MLFIFLLFLNVAALNALKIDRVILATNTDARYIQFWPIVAQAWQELVGIRPTLILVAPKSVHVDTTFGDVIRFEPLKGIPTGYQAQVIRLFAPLLFPDEICIISDIDMLPLQSEFFKDTVKDCDENDFNVFWQYDDCERYSMCYLVAKGSTFGELFGSSWANVARYLYDWHKAGFGWHTDEMMLMRYLREWKEAPQRFVLLNPTKYQRITRQLWGNDPIALKNRGFYDADLLRPYVENKKIIDLLLNDLGLDSRIDLIKPLACDKNQLGHQYSSEELSIADSEIQKLIQSTDIVKVIDNSQALAAFCVESSFIHFLKFIFNGSEYSFIKEARNAFKRHQIALFQFKVSHSCKESKKIMRTILRLVDDCDYVLFKLTSNGIMHVPKRTLLGDSYDQATFIAFAPEYARGWDLFQDK